MSQKSCKHNLQDDFGRLTLHWANQNGYADVLQVCLKDKECAADIVNKTTRSGDTRTCLCAFMLRDALF